MLLNQKYVSNIPSYADIINGIFPNWLKKKETKNPDEMKIKDDLVLNGMTQEAGDKIEYNTIGAFRTSDSNTPGYYIFQWIGNVYTLQEKYTCHAFDPPVIIPEGELVFTAKFMTPMRKTPYWYHDKYEATPVMVKLKKVVMPLIKLIQYDNTTNKLPSRFKGYIFMNPNLWSEHDHHILLNKIEARENINHDEYVEDENYYNVDSDDYDDDDN